MRSERDLTEVLLAFLFASICASVFFHLQGVSFLQRNLHVFVAAVFVLLPELLLRKRGGIERYGFTTAPRALGLKVFGGAVAIIFPLFIVGFVGYHRALCAFHPQLWCVHLHAPHLRLPPDFWVGALAQVVVVAIPEELFFRAYVQGRLEEVWRPTVRVLGAPLGRAWFLTAVLFGLGHFLVTFEPQMLTRFFPGLVFGWMYARTRSIFASVLFHASCNLLMEVLVRSFLT